MLLLHGIQYYMIPKSRNYVMVDPTACYTGNKPTFSWVQRVCQHGKVPVRSRI